MKLDVEMIKKLVGFVSKRGGMVIALGAAFVYFGDKMTPLQSILLAAAVFLFVISQTCEDIAAIRAGKPAQNGLADTGGEMGSGRIGAMLLALVIMMIAAALWPAPARAEILPWIDKLDLQAGPGIEVTDWKPLEFTPCVVATAKVRQWHKLQLRVGGLVNDERRAFVGAIARSLNDVVIRKDGEVQKVLLPTVGIWGSASRDEELQADGTNKDAWKFTLGFNACYEY